MKKIILFFLLFIIFSGRALAGSVDYDEIYNNIPTIDIYYDQNEDPDEQTDYMQYFNSPYPLIRTAFPLSCKSIKFKQGYYLLTPKSKDGFNFMMFKQTGKIIGLVPVYEKRLMTPEERQRIFPPPPKKKHSVWSLPWRGFKFTVKKMFGNYKKPPELPRVALDADIVGGGKYFEIIFYKEYLKGYVKENSKEIYKECYVYKMLFKIER